MGDVSSHRLVVNSNHISSGYGFVTYYNNSDAEKAISLLNGKIFGNYKMQVSY